MERERWGAAAVLYTWFRVSPDVCLIMVVFDELNVLTALVDEEPDPTCAVPGSRTTGATCFVGALPVRIPCVTVLTVWLVIRLVRTIVL